MHGRILSQCELSLGKDLETKYRAHWSWSIHFALYAPANEPAILALSKTPSVIATAPHDFQDRTPAAEVIVEAAQ